MNGSMNESMKATFSSGFAVLAFRVWSRVQIVSLTLSS